jgi:shikimate dehydrogenase
MDRFAVFGHPVAHSASPRLHAAFARQTGQTLGYDKRDIEPGDFARAVADFFAGGGRGANVTLPFKQAALKLADRATDRARRAGAVNTLWQGADGRLMGDNTDGAGFMRDLTVNRHVELAGARILLLGAGGAARGVLGPLIDRNPARLHIANRTQKRALALAHAQAGVTASDLSAWPTEQFDLVINATAAGHGGRAVLPPRDRLAPGSIGYDLNYGEAAAPFLEAARERGIRPVFDGWGMLVEQAAEAFYLWRGARPETASLLAAGPFG